MDGIGSTEMLHIFIAARPEEIRPGATGKPVPGYEARVIDEAGNPVPDGVIGRLAVRGPTGCRYLADERQKKYVEGGWNVTGDTYLRDADGYFWYQARSDDMIISSGYNIAGPEVEGVLLSHPAVAECAVVGVPDDERGALVKAFVVLAPGNVADEAMTRDAAELRQGDHRTLQISPQHRIPRSNCQRPRPASCSASGCAARLFRSLEQRRIMRLRPRLQLQLRQLGLRLLGQRGTTARGRARIAAGPAASTPYCAAACRVKYGFDQMRPAERHQIGAAGGQDGVDLVGGGDVADAHRRDSRASLRIWSANGVWNMRP